MGPARSGLELAVVRTGRLGRHHVVVDSHQPVDVRVVGRSDHRVGRRSSRAVAACDGGSRDAGCNRREEVHDGRSTRLEEVRSHRGGSRASGSDLHGRAHVGEGSPSEDRRYSEPRSP